VTEHAHLESLSSPDSARRQRREYLLAALLGMAFMTAVQSGSWSIADNDGYYHVKMAMLLPELGYTQSFPWLHWTIFRDQFVSHHHGFQTLLLPFVWLADQMIGDPPLGGKIATVAAMGATFALLALVLRQLNVSQRFLWLILLGAVPWHFWMRQTYVRAPMVALPLLLLAVLWHLRGRTLAIALLGFVFTHVYGGGVLFPLVSLAFLGGAWCSGDPLRLPIRQCLCAGIGVVLGFVINPYFPANMKFLYTQIFVTGLAAPSDVGSEWKPYQAWDLLMQAGVLAAVYLACLLRRLQSAAPSRSEELSLLLLNAIFLVLTLKSRRFVEYWPIFAVLSAAALCARARFGVRPAPTSAFAWADFSRRGAVIVAALALLGCAYSNLQFTRTYIRPARNLAAIDEAMRFLKANSPSGSLVLTDDWDSFPACFYFNHHNTYAVGLDPEFTRTRYPALWERYRRITRAELPAKPEESRETDGSDEILYSDIAARFRAQYVLVATDHRPLYKALLSRPEEFTLIYPPGWKSKTAQPAITVFQVQNDSGP